MNDPAAKPIRRVLLHVSFSREHQIMSERDFATLKQSALSVSLVCRRDSKQEMAWRNRIGSNEHSRRHPLLSCDKLVYVQQRVAELRPGKSLQAACVRALVRPKDCRGKQLPLLLVIWDHCRDGFRQQFKLIGQRERFLPDNLEAQPIRSARCNPARQFAELGAADPISRAIGIKLRKILCRDKLNARNRTNVIDVSSK